MIALVVAIISAAASFASAWYSRRANRLDRLEEADQIALRFREPLLQAAFNLQSRLYNIAHGALLARLRQDLNADADREYVVENTLYLIGQYLCWVEILRRESQFIDLRNLKRNSDLATALESVRDSFAESEYLTGPLRVFRGDQRAIAEKFCRPADPGPQSAPRWDAMGYAEFLESRSDPNMDRWFARLRGELTELSDGESPNFDRLIRVQRALVDLLDLLDPDHLRITSCRTRLSETSTHVDTARSGDVEHDADGPGRRNGIRRSLAADPSGA